MTQPSFNTVVGDYLTQNNGTEWIVVERFDDLDLGVVYVVKSLSLTPPQYGIVYPADQSKFTKKEPTFIVGHQYIRPGDPGPLVYNVAIVDGDNVLVWWQVGAARSAGWIPYTERKYFTEVLKIK